MVLVYITFYQRQVIEKNKISDYKWQIKPFSLLFTNEI